jgi:hypothetical protein
MTAGLSAKLRQLGLTAKDVNALYLVPATAVAWADGEVQTEELEAIAAKHCGDCAEGSCLSLSESGRRFLFYHFAYQRPSADMLRAALRCLSDHLSGQPPEVADRLRRLVFAVAVDVARSTGARLLSRGQAVSTAEKLTIANVAGALGFHDIPALLQLIEEAR